MKNEKGDKDKHAAWSADSEAQVGRILGQVAAGVYCGRGAAVHRWRWWPTALMKKRLAPAKWTGESIAPHLLQHQGDVLAGEEPERRAAQLP